MSGIFYAGIRLLDDKMDYVVDVMWQSAGDNWTEPQEIPAGQKIIGVKVNTFWELWITGLSFILL